MKKRYVVPVAILGIFVDQARCQMAAPIKLRQTYELPAEVKGNFDHFGIDLKGGRLFATPEGYHAVVVFRSEEHTLNSSHMSISYAVFCLKKKKKNHQKSP